MAARRPGNSDAVVISAARRRPPPWRDRLNHEMTLDDGLHVTFPHLFLSICAAEALVLNEVCSSDLHLLVLLGQEIYSRPHRPRRISFSTSVWHKHKHTQTSFTLIKLKLNPCRVTLLLVSVMEKCLLTNHAR